MRLLSIPDKFIPSGYYILPIVLIHRKMQTIDIKQNQFIQEAIDARLTRTQCNLYVFSKVVA